MAVILASASPRRRELMKLIMDDFDIANADVDEREIERRCEGLGPAVTAMELARSKAAAVPETRIVFVFVFVLRLRFRLSVPVFVLRPSFSYNVSCFSHPLYCFYIKP